MLVVRPEHTLDHTAGGTPDRAVDHTPTRAGVLDPTATRAGARALHGTPDRTLHGTPDGGGREHHTQCEPSPRPLAHRVRGRERPEAAGPELHAAHAPRTFELPREQAEPDARHLTESVAGAEALEDEVHRRVRDDMGDIRLGQLPVDQPVMLQVGPQRLGGFAAAETYPREELGGVDDPLGVTAWT